MAATKLSPIAGIFSLGLVAVITSVAGISLCFWPKLTERRCVAGMCAAGRWIGVAWMFGFAVAIAESADPNFGLWNAAKPAWTLSPIWPKLTTGLGVATAFAMLYGLMLYSAYRVPPYRTDDSRHCPQCGYDLRGTRAAGIGRCPECGAGVQALAGGDAAELK